MTENTPRHLSADEAPVNEAQNVKPTVFTNKTYDALKYLAQILLPALGALYFGLASVWHLPKAGEVVGTVTVVDTFLGAILLLSAKSYENSDAKYDGVVNIQDADDMTRKMSMELNATPEELASKKDIAFKVVNH